MKKIKFHKNKLLLMGGLLLTAITIPIVAVVATSCSNSQETTSSYTLTRSYSPSSELKTLFSEQQYNDMYNFLVTFDGSNNLYVNTAIGQNSVNWKLMMKNIKTNSFVVSGNKVDVDVQFDMTDDKGTNQWAFCLNKNNWTLNPNNNDDTLFTYKNDQWVGDVVVPNRPEYETSKSDFMDMLNRNTLSFFNQLITSNLIKWEN